MVALLADLNWSAPAGEAVGTTRKVGGFHVALTGEILPYSLWDLNYRLAVLTLAGWSALTACSGLIFICWRKPPR